jgi:hypothetical protein
MATTMYIVTETWRARVRREKKGIVYIDGVVRNGIV